MLFIFGLVIIMGMFAAMLASMGMSADAIVLTVPFTLIAGLLLFVILKFAHGIKAHFSDDEERVRGNGHQTEPYQPVFYGVIDRPKDLRITARGNIHTGIIFPDPANDPNNPQDSDDAVSWQINRNNHEHDRNGKVGWF